jgi:hypothetical protein
MVGIPTVTTSKAKKPLLFCIAVLILFAFSLTAYSQTSVNCPIAAYEGELVQLNPAAFDPDPEIGPAGKLLWTFGPPFDNQGKWQTMKGQRGIFPFWLSVSDGELKDTNHSCIELLPNNRNPILSPVPEIYITRGENTNIDVTCTDPDGDPVEINYRFNGKDVAYILYEPPGTYNLDITCTDGFGGVDSQRTKLHIDMPKPAPSPKPAPKPAVVVAEPKPKPKPKPTEVQVVLPKAPPANVSKPQVIEVRMPKECPPCPTGDVEVVMYDSIYPVQDLTNTTSSFVVEPKPAPAPKPTPAPAPAEPDVVIRPCDEDLKRKQQITEALGCC